MRVQQFIKQLTPSNCGETEMNDVYITIAKNANPIEIFGEPPRDIKCLDRATNEILLLKFKHESNGEYRLSKLGPYIRSKKAKPGDDIYIERRDVDSQSDPLFIININKSTETLNSQIQNPKWQRYNFKFKNK